MAPMRRLLLVCLAIGMLTGLSVSRTLVGQEKPAKKPEQKRYSLKLQNKPWRAVIEWLVVETDLPLISTAKPPMGKLSANPPKSSHPDGYTIPEIIDILNDALASEKYLLLRCQGRLTVIAADEPVPPDLVRTIEAADLGKFGRTELVRLAIGLRGLDAKELAPEVKKMLGPFGSVTTLGHNLVVQDAAGNLKRIAGALKEIQDTAKEAYSHRCAHLRAGEAVKLIEALLTPRGVAKADQALSLAIDKRTNTVFVSGSAERIAQARAILTKIDVPAPGQAPVALGPPILKSYAVPPGQAEALVSILRKIFRAGEVEITAAGNNSLLVWADPEDQMTIARHIQSAAPPPAAVEVIPLSNLQAVRAADMLRAMFGRTPFIEAEADANALLVRGTREQIAEVRAALIALTQGPPQSASVRVINLERGSAAVLAGALQKLLVQTRPNPVRVIIPGEPRKQAKEDAAKPKAKGEITITAIGSKLIVASDDPQALAVAQELIRLLTTTQVSDGEFEIIRLKNAEALAVSRILDDVFNGPRPAVPGKGRLGSPEDPVSRTQRVRIVADPPTNSILVKGSPLDLLTIRQLVTLLDVEQEHEQTAARPRVLGPFKHAKADELAKVLREVYRDQAANFSATADPRTNTLILRAPAAWHEEIQRLLQQLDTKE